MKIKRIMIDNYAPFDKTEIELDNGAYIVIGQNNTDQQVSSNGAGKSCLIQAVVWCLFGEVIRPGLKVDDIVGPLRKHVRVVLEFEKDGRHWKIDRARHYSGRKSNEPLIWIDGEEVTQHKKNDEFIQQQLGFSFNVFMFAGYSDSEHPPFCTLTPANLMKAFADVLELDKINSAIEKLKTQASYLEGSGKRIIEERYRLESKMSMARSMIQKLEKRIAEFDDDLEQQKNDVERQLESARTELVQLRDISSHKKKYDQILQNINKELQVFEDKQKRIKVLNKERDDLLLKISKHEGQLKKIKVEIENKRREWANLAENETCECSYCGSTFKKEEAIRRAALLMDEVEKIAELHVEAEAHVRNFKLKLDPVNKEISQLEEQLQDFQSLHSDKQQVMLILRDIDNAIKRAGELEGFLIPKLTTTLNKLYESSSSFEQEMLDAKLKELEEYEAEGRRYSEEEALIEKRKEQVPSIRKRFVDLKITVMEEFLASLEAQINHNLGLMGTDIQCSINLEMGIKLELAFTNGSKDGRFYPYSIFSRGERSKIDKACSIALNEVFGIGLYIDDEGLSGVDWEASKGLLDFLCDSESTRFLVFHNERIQSSIDMKGVGKIVVSKTEGKSYAKRQN